MKLILALMAMMPLTANALLCKDVTEDGRTVFMFKPGTTPTLTVSGTVAKIPQCPTSATITVPAQTIDNVLLTAANFKNIIIERPVYVDTPVPRDVYVDREVERTVYKDVIVERPIYKDYVAPNPVNDCERGAVLACDPAWKGLPIGNISEMKGYCGFVLVTTKPQDNTEGIVRYLHGAPYSGLKINTDGSTSCPNPVSLK